jgi:CHASE3 domain sensor protein
VHANQARKTAQGWQLHTMEVLLTAEQVRSAANQALRGARGYLITGDSINLDLSRKGTATPAFKSPSCAC